MKPCRERPRLVHVAQLVLVAHEDRGRAGERALVLPRREEARARRDEQGALDVSVATGGADGDPRAERVAGDRHRDSRCAAREAPPGRRARRPPRRAPRRAFRRSCPRRGSRSAPRRRRRKGGLRASWRSRAARGCACFRRRAGAGDTGAPRARGAAGTWTRASSAPAGPATVTSPSPRTSTGGDRTGLGRRRRQVLDTWHGCPASSAGGAGVHWLRAWRVAIPAPPSRAAPARAPRRPRERAPPSSGRPRCAASPRRCRRRAPSRRSSRAAARR